MDILFELLAKDGSSLPPPWDTMLEATLFGTPLFSLVIFSILLITLVPLYIVGIYPMTAEKSIKQALRHAKSIDLDANTSSDSDTDTTDDTELESLPSDRSNASYTQIPKVKRTQ